MVEFAKDQDDIASLARPMVLGSSMLLQLMNAYQTATSEVLNYLESGCEVIIECAVCRSLFRSLANFIAHKRLYCKVLRGSATVQEKSATMSSNAEMSEKSADVSQKIIDDISSTSTNASAPASSSSSGPVAMSEKTTNRRKRQNINVVKVSKASRKAAYMRDKRQCEREIKNEARTKRKLAREKQKKSKKQDTESVDDSESQSQIETPTVSRTVTPSFSNEIKEQSETDGKSLQMETHVPHKIIDKEQQITVASANKANEETLSEEKDEPISKENWKPFCAGAERVDISDGNKPLQIISIPSEGNKTGKEATNATSQVPGTSGSATQSTVYIPASAVGGPLSKLMPVKLVPLADLKKQVSPIVSKFKVLQVTHPLSLKVNQQLTASVSPLEGKRSVNSLSTDEPALKISKLQLEPHSSSKHHISLLQMSDPSMKTHPERKVSLLSGKVTLLPKNLVLAEKKIANSASAADKDDKQSQSSDENSLIVDESKSAKVLLPLGKKPAKAPVRVPPLFPPDSADERAEWENEIGTGVGSSEDIKKEFRLTASDIKERTDCEWETLKCLKCDTSYSCMKTLVKHMTHQHTDKRVFYPCIFCHNIYAQNKNVIRHIVIHHGKTMKFISHIRDFLRSLAFVRALSHVDSQKIAANEKEFMEKVKRTRADLNKPTPYSSMTDDEIIDKYGKRNLNDIPRCGRPPKVLTAEEDALKTKEPVKQKLVYPCPDCSNVYAQLRNVVRHLQRQHSKSYAEVTEKKNALEEAAYLVDDDSGLVKKERTLLLPIFTKSNIPKRHSVLDEMLAKKTRQVAGESTGKRSSWSKFKTRGNGSVKFKRIGAQDSVASTSSLQVCSKSLLLPPQAASDSTLVSVLKSQCRVCHRSFSNSSDLDAHSQLCEQTDASVVSELKQAENKSKVGRKMLTTLQVAMSDKKKMQNIPLRSLIPKSVVKIASDSNTSEIEEKGKTADVPQESEEVIAVREHGSGDGSTSKQNNAAANASKSINNSAESDKPKILFSTKRKSSRTPKPKKKYMQ